MYRPAYANRRADEDVVVSVLSQGVPPKGHVNCFYSVSYCWFL